MARLCPPTPQLLHEVSHSHMCPGGRWVCPGVKACSAESGAGSAGCGSVSKAPCDKQGTQCCCFSCVVPFPGQPKCFRVPVAGDVGNAWALPMRAGQHLELWAGSFLACGTACLLPGVFASSHSMVHHLSCPDLGHGGLGGPITIPRVRLRHK